MKWYYYSAMGKRVGPFSDDEFRRLAQTGVVEPSTTVENESGQKAQASRVAGLFSTVPARQDSRLQSLRESLEAVDSKLNGVARRVAELEKRDGVSGDCSVRLDALEMLFDGARSGLTKRVADLEKKGDASGNWSKRLDALETSVGGARSGLTKRVAELEKKSASGDLAKRLEIVEQQGLAVGGLAVRLASFEKSSDVKVDALTKRVEELQNRTDATSAWMRRLDALTRRLDTRADELAKRVDAFEGESDADLSRRMGVWEKRIEKVLDDFSERLKAVETASEAKTASSDETRRDADVGAQAELLSQKLETFNVRLERLAERLDALERRLDENERLDDLALEDADDDARLVEWGESASEPTEESERLGGAATGDEAREERASAQTRRLEAGRRLVGVDLPAGKYRAEIWQNWASVEVELGENYRCYVLETGDVVDGYESFAIVDLPDGATVTLDYPVDFTYLSELR